MRKILVAAGMVLILTVPASAASLTTTLTDPVGDTVNLNSSTITPAYMDMAGAMITKKGSVFEFSMTLAATLPASPTLAAQTKEIWWLWALDTDPTTAPAGFPRSPGTAVPPEFDVVVAWDGSRYRAYLDDRRPLLTGGDNIFTPIKFTRKGTQLSAFVDATALGDPTTFGVRLLTAFRMTSQAAEGFTFADLLPDANMSFVQWPS